ncbi:MFS transporter [Planctomicrobium sp. SH661]|uniref:MFS transporter n=1 Tax=Planctomicrobium sp. SH661 TaxID=3448124 RepID=UPI003F5B8AAE
MNSVESATPSIYRDRSFWGMTLTQFLAVFNDNFYKQTVMLSCVMMEKETPGTWKNQALATIVFSLPFILFSGYCGFLADRFSKRTIIVVSKLAEIGIMLLAMVAFHTNHWGLMFFVLFLLGIHSTLYAPAKYGLLPELFTENQLPKVNGLFQLSMFVAIILGIAAAGIAAERVHEPWIVTLICMCIAGVGFLTSLMIHPTPAAKPRMKFNPSDLILNVDTRKVIFSDRRLLAALLATSAFWATGGMVYPQAINDVGMSQLNLDKEITSYMAAGTGMGIAVGCVVGMLFSHGMFNATLVRFGSFGMFLGLVALALPGPLNGTLLGVWGTSSTLVWLGICAGIYNVPLQVLIQARAPEEHKGRVIGAMSLANWVGIYFSGVLLLVLKPMIIKFNLPLNLLFAAGAVFFLPIILFYRPKSEALKSYIPHHESESAAVGAVEGH